MSLRFEWDEDKAACNLRKYEIVSPPLVIGMTEVGEQTGHEPEIFRELSQVLDCRVRAAAGPRPGCPEAYGSVDQRDTHPPEDY